MTEQKHTPGEWSISRSSANRHSWRISAVVNGRPAAIANTALWLPTDPQKESEANARLIAAAPELLAACKAVSRIIDTLPNTLADVAPAIKAAVVKAEG